MGGWLSSVALSKPASHWRFCEEDEPMVMPWSLLDGARFFVRNEFLEELPKELVWMVFEYLRPIPYPVPNIFLPGCLNNRCPACAPRKVFQPLPAAQRNHAFVWQECLPCRIHRARGHRFHADGPAMTVTVVPDKETGLLDRFSVRVFCDDTVHLVKLLIFAERHVPVEIQTLRFQDINLLDDDTLYQHRIQHNDFLALRTTLY